MNISVELSNLGPLRSAEVDLAGLTLLVGENNTGKTFFATVLHRVLNAAAPFRPRRRRIYTEQVPPEVEEWINKVLDDSSDDLDDSDSSNDPDSSDEEMTPNSPAMSPSSDTLRWAAKFTRTTSIHPLRCLQAVILYVGWKKSRSRFYKNTEHMSGIRYHTPTVQKLLSCDARHLVHLAAMPQTVTFECGTRNPHGKWKSDSIQTTR